jgi:hypothetical protein
MDELQDSIDRTLKAIYPYLSVSNKNQPTARLYFLFTSASRKSEQMDELQNSIDRTLTGDLPVPEREQQKPTNRKTLLLVYLSR